MAEVRWLALAAVLAAVLAPGSAVAELVSHRAIYALSLKAARHDSGITGLSGRMYVDIADSCEGWIYNQRMALETEGTDATTLTESSFTSWEAKDGSRFRFEQRSSSDGMVVETIGGDATASADAWGEARLESPEARTIPLPPGTLFPSRHTERLIARAEAGADRLAAIVFDGSSLINPNRVSAFIGQRIEMPSLTDDAATVAAWPMHLAFFPLASRKPAPDVEMGVLLQADGVIRAVDLDYGEFSVHGELTAFELFPPPGC